MKCDFCNTPVAYKNVLMFTNVPLGKPVKKIVADEKCEELWKEASRKEAKETDTIIFDIISS